MTYPGEPSIGPLVENENIIIQIVGIIEVYDQSGGMVSKTDKSLPYV